MEWRARGSVVSLGCRNDPFFGQAAHIWYLGSDIEANWWPSAAPFCFAHLPGFLGTRCNEQHHLALAVGVWWSARPRRHCQSPSWSEGLSDSFCLWTCYICTLHLFNSSNAIMYIYMQYVAVFTFFPVQYLMQSVQLLCCLSRLNSSYLSLSLSPAQWDVMCCTSVHPGCFDPALQWHLMPQLQSCSAHNLSWKVKRFWLVFYHLISDLAAYYRWMQMFTNGSPLEFQGMTWEPIF